MCIYFRQVETSIIKVDGGMANNKYLMQLQSNLLDRTLLMPVNMGNMTAMGALYVAGIGMVLTAFTLIQYTLLSL